MRMYPSRKQVSGEDRGVVVGSFRTPLPVGCKLTMEQGRALRGHRHRSRRKQNRGFVVAQIRIG